MAVALGAATASARDCADAVVAASRHTAVDAWLHVERLPGVAVTATAEQVSALRGGRVERVAVAAGDRVQVGDLLVQLTSDPLQRELQAATSAAAVAAGEWSAQGAEVARLERERARREAHPQLFAREEREAHDALLQSARARLDAAAARRDEAVQRTAALDREQKSLRLLANTAGVVGKLRVQAGVVVPDGASLLEISAAAGTVFRFALPASRASALRVGDELCVLPADANAAPVPARLQRLSSNISDAAQIVVAEAAPSAPLAADWQGLAIDVLPLSLPPGQSP